MSLTVTYTFANEYAALDFLQRVAARAAPAGTTIDVAPAKAETARPDPKADKPAAAPKAAPKPAPAPAPAPASIEYGVLQKAVFELAAKDKPKAMSLLQQFGVKSFRELAPERYVDALAAVQAAEAEVA